MLYAKREPSAQPSTPEAPTIAVAFRTSEWRCIDHEVIDFAELGRWFPQDPAFGKAKHGLLALLESVTTGDRLVLGNAQFVHDELLTLDHVKFAQAAHYLERTARFCRRKNFTLEDSLPFISGGDFDSLPVSSALSVFYNENVEAPLDAQSPSTWKIPRQWDPSRRQKYHKINK